MPHSGTDDAKDPRQRMAYVTKCSGKDRVSFHERTHLIAGAALDAGKQPHAEASSSGTDVRPHDDILLDDASSKARAARSYVSRRQMAQDKVDFDSGGTKRWSTVQFSRARMCLASACSLLNATQADREQIDVAAIVDEDTPQHILDGYEKMGVRVIDLSSVRFPHFFNRVTRRRPTGPLRNKTSTREALSLGFPHYSSVPDSWYKLWLWNLTEYSKVVYVDPDMMVLGNVTRSVMQRYQDFAAVHFPYSLYIAAGLMVLRPDANVFANMYLSLIHI